MTRPTRALQALARLPAWSSSRRSVSTLMKPTRPRTIASAATAPSLHLLPSATSCVAGPSRLRLLSTTSARRHGDIVRPKPGTGIKVTYQDSKGKVIQTIEGNEGDDLLSLAHEHDIDLEGACERSVACSTCHVIVAPEFYDKLPDPEDDENDMLDLAFGLEDTCVPIIFDSVPHTQSHTKEGASDVRSRLGCQVVLTKELDGIVVRLPSATRNMYVDGAYSMST